MDRAKRGCGTVENSGCGEERRHREAAVVIVTATTFQVTERSFPLSCLCVGWKPFWFIETDARIHVDRLIAVYTYNCRGHNHPRQLRRVHNILKVVYLHGIRPANFGPADVVLPSVSLAASTCLEGTEILGWVNCGPFACGRLYSLGSILYRASAESPS